jgi:hypothetical protein
VSAATQAANLVGRAAELRRLQQAVRAREELLIWGEADSGKTAVVKAGIAALPDEIRKVCLYVEGAASVKELLQRLVGALYENKDAAISGKWRAAQASHYTFGGWLREQPSGRLHRMFCESLAARPCWIFLDHLPPCTHSLAKFLKQLLWRWHTPVYVIARGITPMEAGHAWSLYWTDKLRLRLGPLPEAEAIVLREQSIRRFGLVSLELEEFRQDVLRLSGRVPGTIVRMCALAADPKYHFQRRIKARLIHVDYLLGRDGGSLRFPDEHRMAS